MTNFNIILPPAMKLLLKKNNDKKKTTSMGIGEGGEWEWGVVWTVTPPTNECMGVLLKKMSLPTH